MKYMLRVLSVLSLIIFSITNLYAYDGEKSIEYLKEGNNNGDMRWGIIQHYFTEYKYTKHKIVFGWVPGATKAQKNIIGRQIGVEYDRGHKYSFNMFSGYMCSTLITEIYRQAGIIFLGNKNEAFPTPASIYYDPRVDFYFQNWTGYLMGYPNGYPI